MSDEDTNECNVCGTELEPDVEYCPECGADFSPEESEYNY